MHKSIFFSLFISIFFMNSCYYDNEEELYPTKILNDCDTLDIGFEKTIRPILKNHCLNCHSAETAPSLGKSIVLESYEQVKSDVDKGSFQGSIKYETPYTPMPEDYKLDDCTIRKIEIWIKQGAENE